MHTRRTLLVVVLALALAPVACLRMAPDVHRQNLPIPVVAGTPASEGWINEDLAKKGWTEGDSGWKEKKKVPTTAYSDDQGYMIMLRKPKPETWKHTRDLISEMIWAREGRRK